MLAVEHCAPKEKKNEKKKTTHIISLLLILTVHAQLP